MMDDANGQCEPCTAAWGDIEWGCADRHDDAHQSLAEALALVFNPWESDDARLEHVGWFMEDAEEIISSGKVEGPPWIVKPIVTDADTKFSVNGRFCIAREGEKSRGSVEVYGRER